MSNRLRRSGRSRVVGHRGITRLPSWRARRRCWSCWWSRERWRIANAWGPTGMRNCCILQPCNDWAQRIVLVFRENRRGVGVAGDLELMWLHYSA
jgi:hypothetical protein